MKKSDLKTGMIVEMNNGDLRMVLGNALMGMAGASGGITLAFVDDELLVRRNHAQSIVKVFEEAEKSRNNYIGADVSWFSRASKDTILCHTVCLWTRAEPKNMTIIEIEKILGYRIKVVGE